MTSILPKRFVKQIFFDDNNYLFTGMYVYFSIHIFHSRRMAYVLYRNSLSVCQNRESIFMRNAQTDDKSRNVTFR